MTFVFNIEPNTQSLESLDDNYEAYSEMYML